MNALLEPSIRRAFQAHSETELARVIANVPAERDASEVVIAGRAPVPLLIAEGERFGDPVEVVQGVIDEGQVPLHRGRTVMAAEVTREGIRFHEVRLRTTDGSVQVRSMSTLTPETRLQTTRPVPPSGSNGSDLAALGLGVLGALGLAIGALRSDTATVTNPVRTTD